MMAFRNTLYRFVPLLRRVVSRQMCSRASSTGPGSMAVPPHRTSHESTVLINNLMPKRTTDSSRLIVSNVQHIDGMKIHFEVTGSGNNTVLLLPGAAGSSRTDFSLQLENLNKDLFKLVAWDPPGYGKSTPNERQWVPKFLHRDAEIVAQLMQNLDVKRYSVLGWSDGGITALILAAMQPERVNKLIVWGANSYVTREETEMYQTIRNIDSWSDKMKKPFIDLYGEDYFRRLWSGWVDGFIQHYYNDNTGDICNSELAKIECPTLIIHGQMDPLVHQFHADHLNANIKGSRLHNMPEGKHNLHMRYYKEFNSLVESFLLEI